MSNIHPLLYHADPSAGGCNRNDHCKNTTNEDTYKIQDEKVQSLYGITDEWCAEGEDTCMN